MDGGAWWAAVHGVAQCRTRLKRLSSSSSTFPLSFLRDQSFSLLFSKSPLNVSHKTCPLDNAMISSTGSSSQHTVSIGDQRTLFWGSSCALQSVDQYLWSPPRLLLMLFSRSVLSNSLRPRGPQHTRLPCPSPSPGVCSKSRPLSQ